MLLRYHSCQVNTNYLVSRSFSVFCSDGFTFSGFCGMNRKRDLDTYYAALHSSKYETYMTVVPKLRRVCEGEKKVLKTVNTREGVVVVPTCGTTKVHLRSQKNIFTLNPGIFEALTDFVLVFV